MNDSKKEIIFLPQISFDTTYNCRAISIADLCHNHSDGVGAFVAQTAGEKIRTVVQFLRAGVDAVLGFLWDGARRRRVIQNRGNCPRSQPQMMGNFLERDHLRLLAWFPVWGHDLVKSIFSTAFAANDLISDFFGNAARLPLHDGILCGDSRNRSWALSRFAKKQAAESHNHFEQDSLRIRRSRSLCTDLLPYCEVSANVATGCPSP